jgi:hypothetical protein
MKQFTFVFSGDITVEAEDYDTAYEMAEDLIIDYGIYSIELTEEVEEDEINKL